MQILRTTYMKVIKNYDYMTTMDEKHEFDENVSWMKLTHLLSEKSLM